MIHDAAKVTYLHKFHHVSSKFHCIFAILVGCSVSILVMARAGQLGAVFLVSGAVGNLVDRFYVGGAARRIGEFMCYSCDFHVIFL